MLGLQQTDLLIRLNFDFKTQVNKDFGIIAQLKERQYRLPSDNINAWIDYSHALVVELDRLKWSYKNLHYLYRRLEDSILEYVSLNIENLYYLLTDEISNIGLDIKSYYVDTTQMILKSVVESSLNTSKDITGLRGSLETLLTDNAIKQEALLNTQLQLTHKAITEDVETLGEKIVGSVEDGITVISGGVKDFSTAIKESVDNLTLALPELIENTAENIARRIWIYFRNFVWETE